MSDSLCFETSVPVPGIELWRVGPASRRQPDAITSTEVRSLDELLDALDAAHARLAGPAPPALATGVVLLFDFDQVDAPGLAPDDAESLDAESRHDARTTAQREQVRAAVIRRQQQAARLADLPDSPIVAGIAGRCTGAWGELASWCDRRFVTSSPDTVVGFPGVRRGSLPSLGGTARLPRIIDWRRAVDWLASGESLDAHALVEAGWATAETSPERLLATCLDAIRSLRDDRSWMRERQERRGPQADRAADGRQVVDLALARLRSGARGHEPLSRLAGELVVDAVGVDVPTALAAEAAAVAQLAGSPVQRALRRAAVLSPRLDPFDRASDVRPLGTLAVVGAGLMGAGIAAIALRHGLRVALVDENAAALERARTSVVDDAALDRRRRTIDPARRAELAARLSLFDSIESLPPIDAAIEAVVENPDVKRQVLPRLEARLAPGGLIASNTSTIPIARLAERLVHPARCCGIHFFNPVRIMPLVEVIRGAATSDATIADAVALVRRLGKSPIIVQDSPGFLVNRVLFAYLNEAIQLLHEGATIEAIDDAARTFGMPVGPIELCDIIGIDTVYYAGRTMYSAFPDRTLASPIPPALIKAGRLGQKTGAGFLLYDNPRAPGRADEFTAKLLDTYRRGERTFTRDELTERLMLPMFLEATRVLEERVVADSADVDFGVIHGLGFPAYRGGLIDWAESLGRDELLRRLAPFATLGPRWQPTRWVREMS